MPRSGRSLQAQSASISKCSTSKRQERASSTTTKTSPRSSACPTTANSWARCSRTQRASTAAEFKRDVFGDTAFGNSILRALLYALLLLQKEQDESDVLDQLHDLIQSSHHDGYHARRPQLVAMARYIATKRARTAPLEAQAARILEALLRNERLS
jgi:hypothetical protein